MEPSCSDALIAACCTASSFSSDIPVDISRVGTTALPAQTRMVRSFRCCCMCRSAKGHSLACVRFSSKSTEPARHAAPHGNHSNWCSHEATQEKHGRACALKTNASMGTQTIHTHFAPLVRVDEPLSLSPSLSLSLCVYTPIFPHW